MSMMPLGPSISDITLLNIFGLLLSSELHKSGQMTDEGYKQALDISKKSFDEAIKELKNQCNSGIRSNGL